MELFKRAGDSPELSSLAFARGGFARQEFSLILPTDGSGRPGQITTKPFHSSDVLVQRCLSMPRTDSLQGSLDLLVLRILSRRPKLHGYAIMSAIRDTSLDVLRVEEGSLYPALHRMEEAGWIRAEWIIKDTGRRARLYELTAAGKKQLTAEESRWAAVTAAVNRVLRTA
jgi:PadR family transcriptional regulator PadR